MPGNPFDQTVRPIEVGAPMPALRFVDQHGRTLTFSSLLGQTVLVGFIYTRCNDACPLVTQKFVQLDRLLGTGPYQLVEVTIDPSHDTPTVISAYAHKYGAASARWHVVTGEPAALGLFARSAGVAVIDNGKAELIHNSPLLIISPDGKLADVNELVAWDPRTVAAELQHVAGASSNPLARADFALTKAVAQLCGGSYQVASGIIDVVAALLIISAGVFIMIWVRRRLFAQGA
jgi:cytochrome oxidase Cu insertion factor (SCO1/SenC/PrrC family)